MMLNRDPMGEREMGVKIDFPPWITWDMHRVAELSDKKAVDELSWREEVEYETYLAAIDNWEKMRKGVHETEEDRKPKVILSDADKAEIVKLLNGKGGVKRALEIIYKKYTKEFTTAVVQAVADLLPLVKDTPLIEGNIESCYYCCGQKMRIDNKDVARDRTRTKLGLTCGLCGRRASVEILSWGP